MPHGRSASRRRLAGLVALVGVICVALALTWAQRPGPEGQRFADQALAQMDAAWFAHGTRWDEARRTAWEETRGAPTAADALPALKRALWVAGGSHSSIHETRAGRSSSEQQVPTVETHDGITTIWVPGVASGDEAFLTRYATTLAADISAARATTTCGWIVDLRKNSGGNFMPMLSGLSPLVTDGKVAAFRTHTDEIDVEVRGGQVITGGHVSQVGQADCRPPGPLGRQFRRSGARIVRRATRHP